MPRLPRSSHQPPLGRALRTSAGFARPLLLGFLLGLTLGAAPIAIAAETSAPSPLATCPARSSLGDLELSLAAVEKAYAGLDRDQVLAQGELATRILGCLEKPLGPSHAARFHRAWGLRSFVAQEIETTRIDFAAARRLEPSTSLPAAIAPPGNPLHEAFFALDPSGFSSNAVLAPKDQRLVFDGLNEVRPQGLPCLVQLLDSRRTVLGTWHLAANAPLPRIETLKPAPVATATGVPTATGVATVTPARTEPSSRNPVRKGLFIGAGVSGVSSLALYGLAWNARRNFNQAANPSAATTAYNRNHSFTAASGVAGGLALALASGGLLSGRFYACSPTPPLPSRSRSRTLAS